MPVILPLVNRNSISYESAVQREDNIIQQLAYVDQSSRFDVSLWEAREKIQAITSHHPALGSGDSCKVLGQDAWIRGSFNVCIPVEVRRGMSSIRVLMRCPLAHKLAEATYPGSVDEKLGCEAATYAWMQENCPHVPIPHLFGFGFSDKSHFTHIAHRNCLVRLAWHLRRRLRALFRCTIPSQYTPNIILPSIGTAYMLLEFIEPSAGQMLSNTWAKHRNDSVRRHNLFRGVARLMCSLTRVPQPRIGSFRFHDDGTITLTNRPLLKSTIIRENEGSPNIMQTLDTYNCTEAFVSDMLTFHDNRFLSQPNAAYSHDDCRGQMAVKVLLRALAHRHINRAYRGGPFPLQLTDLHPSNVFVDENWNITYLIDLEWVCSLPREMVTVPYWLTGRAIDQITDEHLNEFDQVREEFIHALQEEERTMPTASGQHIELSSTINDTWESGAVWFWRCLDSVNAMYCLIEDHICSRFSSTLSAEENIISRFWCEGSTAFVANKLSDKERYDQELRQIFHDDLSVGISGK